MPLSTEKKSIIKVIILPVKVDLMFFPFSLNTKKRVLFLKRRLRSTGFVSHLPVAMLKAWKRVGLTLRKEQVAY